MHRRTLLFALAGSLTLPAAARAHSYTQGNIAIGHAWALPSTGPDGQAFFPMVNNGSETDELVSARSSICAAIELRRTGDYAGPPLDSLVLMPGQPMAMRPRARHLRLVGLTRPLVLDQRFTITLTFRGAGEASVEFHVEAAPGE